MQCIEEIEEIQEPGRALSWRGPAHGPAHRTPGRVWRVYYRVGEIPEVQEPEEPEIPEEHVDVVAESAESSRRMVEESAEWDEDHRFMSVEEVKPPFVPGIVRAGFNSSVPAAKTWLSDSDAKTLCAVSAYHFASESAGFVRAEPGVYWHQDDDGQDLERTPPWMGYHRVEPSPSRIRSLTGLSRGVQSKSLSRLEDQGLVKSRKSPNGTRLFCWLGEDYVSRSKSAVTRGMMDVARVIFPPGRPRHLSDVQRDVLGFLLDRGASVSEITKGLNMSFSTISQIKKRQEAILQKTIETIEAVQTPKEISHGAEFFQVGVAS